MNETQPSYLSKPFTGSQIKVFVRNRKEETLTHLDFPCVIWEWCILIFLDWEHCTIVLFWIELRFPCTHALRHTTTWTSSLCLTTSGGSDACSATAASHDVPLCATVLCAYLQCAYPLDMCCCTTCLSSCVLMSYVLLHLCTIVPTVFPSVCWAPGVGVLAKSLSVGPQILFRVRAGSGSRSGSRFCLIISKKG